MFGCTKHKSFIINTSILNFSKCRQNQMATKPLYALFRITLPKHLHSPFLLSAVGKSGRARMFPIFCHICVDYYKNINYQQSLLNFRDSICRWKKSLRERALSKGASRLGKCHFLYVVTRSRFHNNYFGVDERPYDNREWTIVTLCYGGKFHTPSSAPVGVYVVDVNESKE